MPRGSSVHNLPEDVRAELQSELIRRGFQDYDGLVQWLDERFPKWKEITSKSSIGRYGKRWKDKLNNARAAVEAAKVFQDEMGDDRADMSATMIDLMQTELLGVLVSGTIDPDDLPKLTRAVADIARAGVFQRRFRQEIKEKITAEFERMEKESSTGEQKFTPEAMKYIKERIYGIVG